MPPDRYATQAADDVQRLVLENPLAWIVSGAAGALRATLLPLRPCSDPEGRITHLLGHFARRNPQVGELRRDPRAAVLFLGPHGYISPSWFTDRTQAPTWNYASAQFAVSIEFLEDPADLEAILRDLIGAMEAERPDAWTIEDMNARYCELAPRIVAFRATVLDEHAIFKLGQDERDDVYADVRVALERAGRDDLLAWMERCNPGRPPSAD